VQGGRHTPFMEAPLHPRGRDSSRQSWAPMILGMTLLLAAGSLLFVRSSPTSPSRLAPLEAMRRGDDSLMKAGRHGSCAGPVAENLRWGCDRSTADNICCFNRHFAEYAGYWESTSFLKEANKTRTVFRDPVTGKPLFVAPVGRSWDDFVAESRAHGWPSFRSREVVWESVRVLPDGECVSVDGTHLGHNLPDRKGARFCINLVSVAGHARSGEDDGPVPGFDPESERNVTGGPPADAPARR